jgi:hypothetical protein
MNKGIETYMRSSLIFLLQKKFIICLPRESFPTVSGRSKGEWQFGKVQVVISVNVGWGGVGQAQV